MNPEPKLLDVFLYFRDIGSLDKPTQAALRLCNRQIKKVIDATVISCKVKPADVDLLCGCDWKLKQLTVKGMQKQEPLKVLLNALFKNFSLLETLKIEGCYQLEALPENIGELKYLRDVAIIGGNSIKTLPPLSGQLTALEFFGCRALTLEGLAPLKQLHQLKMLGIGGYMLSEDDSFPEWICDNITTGLLDLRLRDAGSLPSKISNFKHLTRLLLDDSFIPELPESIGLLSSLAVLSGPSELLNGLPDSFSQLAALQELDLIINLDEIAPLPHLTGLIKLHLQFYGAESPYLDFISNLTSLKSLRLCDEVPHRMSAGCWLPEDISNLKNLESLYLVGIKNMRTLPDSIQNLSCLTKLDLFDIGLENVPDSIDNLNGLKILNIRFCGDLYELNSAIGELDSLEELRLSYCPEFTKLPDAIGRLHALKVLTITDFCELTAIPESFADLVLGKDGENCSLEQVIIRNCPKLVLSPKMEQALEVLRNRGVLVED